MSDPQDLQHLYTNDLREPLARLESARKRALLQVILLAAGLAVLNVCVFLCLKGDLKALGVFTTLGSLVGFGLLAVYLSERWAKDFKSTIIPQLLTRIEPSLVYQAEGKIESRVFDASGLYEFSQAHDYSGEDLATGTVAGIPVSFCELNVTSPGGKNSGSKKIFKGIFLVAEIDTGSDHSTWVVPQGTKSVEEKMGVLGGVFSNLLKQHSNRKGEKVELEDPDFMEQFSVVAEDEQAARSLLTDDLRKNLMVLRQVTDQELRVSLQPGQVSVALSLDRDYFNPRLAKTILSYEIVRQFVEDLGQALAIVNAVRPVRR